VAVLDAIRCHALVSATAGNGYEIRLYVIRGGSAAAYKILIPDNIINSGDATLLLSIFIGKIELMAIAS
jgi:hypothetical protein